MRIYVQIDEKEPFRPGDIFIQQCEECTSNNGDRSSFIPHKRITIRPIGDLATENVYVQGKNN